MSLTRKDEKRTKVINNQCQPIQSRNKQEIKKVKKRTKKGRKISLRIE